MRQIACVTVIALLGGCAPQTPPETTDAPGTVVASGTAEQPVVGAEAAAAYQAAIAPLAPVIPDMFGAMGSVN